MIDYSINLRIHVTALEESQSAPGQPNHNSPVISMVERPSHVSTVHTTFVQNNLRAIGDIMPGGE
jgi:hypothetical protein